MCPTRTSWQNEANNIGNPDLRSAFNVLDKDGDGKISYDDLRSCYGMFSTFEKVPGDDVIEQMMTAADSDMNGFVEYDEFEKIVFNGRDGGGDAADGVLVDAFRVMDKDGDGKVGHEDLKRYLNLAGFDAGDEEVKAMIKLAGGDDNGGGVTFDSLLKILNV